MRRITLIAIVGMVCALAARAWADYPPYTAALAPSDQFRITDSPMAPQTASSPPLPSSLASPPSFTPSASQSLPPEVPWGQSARPASAPVLMGQGSTPYQTPDPTASTIISPAPAAHDDDCLIESTLYSRVDYFHWHESRLGANFVTEDGELTTIGYQFRYDQHRLRSEIFGSQVHYGAPIDDIPSDPNDFLSSRTGYIGGRFEYECVHNPAVFPELSYFFGIGTRFWLRNLPDAVTDNGYLIGGYEEKWWTVYPYLGIETRRTVEKDTELYGMARVGITAVTWQWATFNNAVLYPRPGVTEQLEAGIRGPHLFLAAFFEGMAWNASEIVYDPGSGYIVSQPTSTMYTIGLKTGYNF